MKKEKYSAKQLCAMYPEKYIAVNHLSINDENIITSAEILKVYDTLEDCKKNISEIKFFLNINKNDFDIIYGDYKDYYSKRKTKTIDAFATFGAIAFEMFNPNFLDDMLDAIKSTK